MYIAVFVLYKLFDEIDLKMVYCSLWFMSIANVLLNFYDKNYKQLMLLSFLLLFISIGVLGFKFVTTGELVQRGVSLKGGLSATIPVSVDVSVADLQSVLSAKFPDADISVRSLSAGGKVSALIIEASDLDEDSLLSVLESQGIALVEGEYSVENMGSSLGENFFRDTVRAVVIAFVFMSIVVYLTFRLPVPSFFVILCAFSDIVSTLAVVSLFGVKLSTAGIAAFLMLIGYSVDTDILLTTKVYKRKDGGSVFERILSAMRTGMVMTVCSFVAVLAAYLVSDSDVVRQIMFILLVGLIFDVVYTWVQNAGILRWYMEWLDKRGS